MPAGTYPVGMAHHQQPDVAEAAAAAWRAHTVTVRDQSILPRPTAQVRPVSPAERMGGWRRCRCGVAVTFAEAEADGRAGRDADGRPVWRSELCAECRDEAADAASAGVPHDVWTLARLLDADPWALATDPVAGMVNAGQGAPPEPHGALPVARGLAGIPLLPDGIVAVRPWSHLEPDAMDALAARVATCRAELQAQRGPWVYPCPGTSGRCGGCGVAEAVLEVRPHPDWSVWREVRGGWALCPGCLGPATGQVGPVDVPEPGDWRYAYVDGEPASAVHGVEPPGWRVMLGDGFADRLAAQALGLQQDVHGLARGVGLLPWMNRGGDVGADGGGRRRWDHYPDGTLEAMHVRALAVWPDLLPTDRGVMRYDEARLRAEAEADRQADRAARKARAMARLRRAGVGG